MNVRVFNSCLLCGWLMTTAGGIVLNVGAGLCGGGLLLIVLTMALARVGGLFVSRGDR